jgi:hypothetical protein
LDTKPSVETRDDLAANLAPMLSREHLGNRWRAGWSEDSGIDRMHGRVVRSERGPARGGGLGSCGCEHWMGKTKSEADQYEGQSMLADLAEVGMRAVTLRS